MTTQLSVKNYFDDESIKTKFKELLGDRSIVFVTSVLQAVEGNYNLKKCEPESIYNAAAMAAVLDLPINQNLGLAWIIPYGKKAQFQIGYKGFIQLAIRSGQYETIGASPIYKGQLTQNDPLKGFVFDFDVPPEGSPIGFAASFTLKNGFEKTFYMTTAQIQAHAKKYSKSYTRTDSPWRTDTVEMSNKTVLKLLLSKYGPKSLEMQKAVLSDQAVVNDFEKNEFAYPDNDKKPESAEADKINSIIEAEIVEEKTETETETETEADPNDDLI